jgi:hypothetical protein
MDAKNNVKITEKGNLKSRVNTARVLFIQKSQTAR